MVLSAATPRLAASYGGFTLDETNGIVISTGYTNPEGPETGSFTIEFWLRLLNPTHVLATDDAAFKTLLDTMTVALKIPRQSLQVTYGSSTVKDWHSGASGTAFMITPLLRKMPESTVRAHKYMFTVTCQLPGNVPSNVYRRESLTTVGTSKRARRSVHFTATWTAGGGDLSYARYLANADTFYTAYLPANITDQHGTTGVWVKADENPAHQDEDSILTASAEFWELFAGRRDSSVMTDTTLDNNRTFQGSGTWVSDATHTALQNYVDNGDTYFGGILPTPIGGGEWILVDANPTYNDANDILTVTRAYQEVVSGLRENRVRVTTDGSGLRHVELSGVYYTTAAHSAKYNYDNNIATLVTGVMAAQTPGISHYESHSVPKITEQGPLGNTYSFKWTLNELAYPQSGGASPTWDDTNVIFEMLNVQLTRPFDKQAQTGALTVVRLQYGIAKFIANIDFQANQDPMALWDAGLRAHTHNAILTKLGAGVSAINITDENVDVGLHDNQIVGTLKFISTGSADIIWMHLKQTLTQVPGIRFRDRADGTAFSAKAYRRPPKKLLHREGACEWVVGNSPPVLFNTGDNIVSGFGLIDTGQSAQESIDMQNDPAEFDGGGKVWHINGDAPAPYSYTDEPSSWGDSGFQTVVHAQIEDWIYIENIEPGTEIG